MLHTYQHPRFPYVASAEQRAGEVRRHPVVIVGAGPIGLTAALECARLGLPAVLIDDNDTVSVGSRALCYAKRPLEIWNRIGVAAAMVARGVQWKVGKVYFHEDLVYQFDLLPEDGHQMPAMINLQQYYLEETLVEACARAPLVDLRWKHRLVGLSQCGDHARLVVETPDGPFEMEAGWVIACDGANSDTRRLVGASFDGRAFQDRFLIADVVMTAPFPAERWFWFDPPFHPGQSVLLHMEADNVWRIDFQLGWDADPDEARKPENVIPLIQAMLGPDVRFELEWVSVYQFACRRVDRFRHGRVLFAGDAAHQVSPFGARGANTGVQDIDNLVWKLRLVRDGLAPESLVDSYDEERAFAADDNLRQSTRSTDFITPKSRASRLLRDAALQLAADEPFARRLVNSGRLSTPTPYLRSSLNTPDEVAAGDAFAGAMTPGTPCADAPVAIDGRPAWFLGALPDGFSLLVFGDDVGGDRARASAGAGAGAAAADAAAVTAGPFAAHGVEARVVRVGTDVIDVQGLLASRYDGRPGTVYLLRPDHHVAARWRRFDETKVAAALARATGR